MKAFSLKLTYPKIISLGFCLLILLGAFLLSLPISSRSGQFTPFLTSLFTATSATCVTGLVMVDTYTHWSVFGQTVIIVLIQIGGIGFMTLMTAISLVLNRQITLKERTLLKDSFNTSDISGMVRLTKHIVAGTVIIELLGSILLATRFIPLLGLSQGLYTAVFMSISAFCNAGFDILGGFGQYSSLVFFSDDALIILTLSMLILIGGIGFIVWDDIVKNKWHLKRYRLHSKIVLFFTTILTIGGTVLFFIFERDATNYGLPLHHQLLNSFFSSVTPRTAGFNSVDVAALTGVSKMLTILYMFIGGSPGSTAGGVKTVTIAVMLICLISNLRNKSGYNVFRRRLPLNVVINALCVIVIHLTLSLSGTLLICAVQPELAVGDVVFECFSAMGTVGMSTGITRDLTVLPQIVLILLMFSGRIGSLSFAMIFTEKKQKDVLLFPEEKVNVG